MNNFILIIDNHIIDEINKYKYKILLLLILINFI